MVSSHYHTHTHRESGDTKKKKKQREKIYANSKVVYLSPVIKLLRNFFFFVEIEISHCQLAKSNKPKKENEN